MSSGPNRQIPSYRLGLETGRIYRAGDMNGEEEPEDEEDELGTEDIENISDLPYNPITSRQVI